MKRMICLGLGILWLSGAVAAEELYNQRYLLFSCTYEIFVSKEGTVNSGGEVKGTCKIDTATGQTWVLVMGVKDGVRIKRWDKVEN